MALRQASTSVGDGALPRARAAASRGSSPCSQRLNYFADGPVTDAVDIGESRKPSSISFLGEYVWRYNYRSLGFGEQVKRLLGLLKLSG